MRQARKSLPAIFFSRILPQSVSAFRDDQFSIFVEKLRKKRYSLTFDISGVWTRDTTAAAIEFKLGFRFERKNLFNRQNFFNFFSLSLFLSLCLLRFWLRINSIYEKISWLRIIVAELLAELAHSLTH